VSAKQSKEAKTMTTTHIPNRKEKDLVLHNELEGLCILQLR
jgi:hypothetical protein